MIVPNSIIHGDCLEVMQDIEDNSIDMILCDLPYGTTACKWDTIIPFEPLWEQYDRICKKTCVYVFTSTQPFTTALINSNIKNFKYCWYWKKPTAPNYPHAKNMPLKIIEDICVFSKNSVGHKSLLGISRMSYNPLNLKKCEYYRKGHRGKTNEDLYSRPSHIGIQKVEYSNYPTSLLDVEYEYDAQLHPTQKPVPLFEYLIKTYTNQGDTVLDNCAGSGTTGVACINTSRNYILIEKEEKYFEICKQRTAEALAKFNDTQQQLTDFSFDNTNNS